VSFDTPLVTVMRTTTRQCAVRSEGYSIGESALAGENSAPLPWDMIDG
jgi:hypothetical protein